MVKNRSIPTNSILPHVYYENLAAARAWLIEAFGFVEDYRFELPDGQLHGVMIHYGDAYVMLKNTSRSLANTAKPALTSHSLTVFVDDVDDHYHRAKAAGVTITEALFETEYGEKQYTTRDLEGHLWTFSQHVRDVSPDSWGATLAGKG